MAYTANWSNPLSPLPQYSTLFLNYMYIYMYMYIHVVKQTNKAKQHSTPKAVTFPRKNELPQVGLEPTTLLYSRQSALPTELPRQLSWLSPNLTSHSTPDEQANHMYIVYMTSLVLQISIEYCYMYMYMYMYITQHNYMYMCMEIHVHSTIHVDLRKQKEKKGKVTHPTIAQTNKHIIACIVH